MTELPIRPMSIKELEDATEMAYSHDRYTKGGWRACIRHLRNNHFGNKEVMAIMQSKHLRWAADMSGRTYGTNNGKCLKQYMEKWPNYFVASEVEKIVAGTF